MVDFFPYILTAEAHLSDSCPSLSKGAWACSAHCRKATVKTWMHTKFGHDQNRNPHARVESRRECRAAGVHRLPRALNRWWPAQLVPPITLGHLPVSNSHGLPATLLQLEWVGQIRMYSECHNYLNLLQLVRVQLQGVRSKDEFISRVKEATRGAIIFVLLLKELQACYHISRRHQLSLNSVTPREKHSIAWLKIGKMNDNASCKKYIIVVQRHVNTFGLDDDLLSVCLNIVSNCSKIILIGTQCGP